MGKSKDLATGAAYQDQTESDTRYANVAGDTFTGNVVASTTLQVGKTSISNQYGSSNGYVADFQATSGAQTYISIAEPNASSLGNNGLIFGEDTGASYLYQRQSKPINFGTNNTTRMTIDASGRVTTPNQPQFVVQGTRNNWTTITDGGRWYQMTGAAGVAATASGSSILPMEWRTTGYGNINPTGSGFNQTTGLYTAPVSGMYMFCFQTYTSKYSGSSGQYYHINGYYNGNNMSDYTIYGYNLPNGAYPTPEITKIIRMSANDTFEFRLYMSTSTTYQIFPYYTCLAGYLLG